MGVLSQLFASTSLILALLFCAIIRASLKAKSTISFIHGPAKDNWLSGGNYRGDGMCCHSRSITQAISLVSFAIVSSTILGSWRNMAVLLKCMELSVWVYFACEWSACQLIALFKREQLYVSDPVAIHQILIKEQDVFDETDMFIMYVVIYYTLYCGDIHFG